MKWHAFLYLMPILGSVTAQSDPLDQLISEAYSVYTQVTSIIASAASAASVAATVSASSPSTLSSVTRASATSSDEDTSSSSAGRSSSAASASRASISSSASTSSTASRSSSASSSDRSSSLAASSGSSRTSGVVGTSSIIGATLETGTALPSANNTSGSGNHKLPIILGAVLGALALGLFILALLICCKRRRQRSHSPRHRALSPGDDEVDSWRVSRPSGLTDASSHHAYGGAGFAPPMSQHPAFRGHQSDHMNPFVPVPPPPRRSAPNSRAGLTDASVPGDDPFLEKGIGGGARPSTSRSRDSSHGRGGALAAGVAGAAVGAGLLHHHHRKQHDDEKTLVTEEPASYAVSEPPRSLDPALPAKISRKPVPINTVNNSEPWPYSPVSPIDPATESTALTGLPNRTSQESRRSFSRDAARANAAFDNEYSPQNHLLHEPELPTPQVQSHGHGQALATAAAGLAVGGIGGAALAHHHDNHRRSRSSSSGSGNRRNIGHAHGHHSHSQSPSRRPGPMLNDNYTPGASTDSSSNNSYTYSDALPAQPIHNQEEPLFTSQPVTAPAPAPLQSNNPPAPYDVPAVPTTRSRRNSALGTAAPSAAVYSYINRPAIPSPLSSEIRHDRSYSPPHMPSRSPRRSSRGRASQDSTAYDDVYSSNPWVGSGAGGGHHYPTHSAMLPSEQPYKYRERSAHDMPPLDSDISAADKAIVGDNGYPHMGVPRRKSGGEYDFENGPFGPQTLPAPTSGEGNATRSSTLNSDDSTWRLSSGMPGGWRRASGEYSRISGEQPRRIPGRLRASDVERGEGQRYYDGVGQAL
ncbi:hypothetical protein LTR84_001924 [Exophiala bonariae]|uniref:Mid2 domain-containing protein n=1 Tax=Exophiala bonariae TaxID=1690606 RepID=A0AAV9NGG7_9EURO|nr:hypothetical protein LTR84_001924 [Exophiala bonariae]